MMKILLDAERSATRRLRVSLAEYKGQARIDLRFFYKGEEGEFHPTKQGVTIEDPRVLDDVIHTLETARKDLAKSTRRAG